MSCSCSKLSFSRRIPIETTADLKLGKKYGGQRVAIRGEGVITFSFEDSGVPNILNVRLLDVKINYGRIDLPHSGKDSARVEGTTIGREDFNLDASSGTLNLETKELTLMLVLELNHLKHRQIASSFGIKSPVRAFVVEKGHFDLRSGDFETHALSIKLDHLPGLLDYQNQKKNCHANPHLYTALANISLYAEIGNTVAWICPGHTVILGWNIEGADKAKNGVLHPDNTPLPAPVTAQGQMQVRPKVTTEYTITVDTDNCTGVPSNKATVVVVEPGTLYQLSAQPSGVVWEVTIPKEIMDPSIVFTSIQLVDCFSTSPIGGISLACNKRDLDGTVHGFNVTGAPSSPGRFQVAGIWRFAAVGAGEYRATGPACFNLTLSCGGS